MNPLATALFWLMNISFFFCGLGKSRYLVIGLETLALALSAGYFLLIGHTTAVLSSGVFVGINSSAILIEKDMRWRILMIFFAPFAIYLGLISHRGPLDSLVVAATVLNIAAKLIINLHFIRLLLAASCALWFFYLFRMGHTLEGFLNLLFVAAHLRTLVKDLGY